MSQYPEAGRKVSEFCVTAVVGSRKWAIFLINQHSGKFRKTERAKGQAHVVEA
jgi:hypothetical protein